MSATAPATIAQMNEASKWYGDVIGLNQVSVLIQPGITGLLGPNGAGKSTFLKLLTGQLAPNRGMVRVLGRDPWADRGVYREMGYCPDSEQLYEEMTGLAFVRLIGRLAGYSARDAALRADVQLERVGMAQHAGRIIHGYSKGMRQRIRLAAALIHEPKLVVLDEPLNGLDPLGRIEMLKIFKDLAASGCSVVVSSHVLHEIENLTRHMIMLHRGRVLAEGEISEVRSLIESQPLTLRVESPQARAVGAAVVGLDSVTSIEFASGFASAAILNGRTAASAQSKSDFSAPPSAVIIRTRTPDAVLETLQHEAAENRLEIGGIEALDDNLDAVFRYLVEEE